MTESVIKKPSLEGLEETKAILKKVYEKAPSDALLGIVPSADNE